MHEKRKGHYQKENLMTKQKLRKQGEEISREVKETLKRFPKKAEQKDKRDGIRG